MERGGVRHHAGHGARGGDAVAELIARIKECEALLKGNLDTPITLVQRLQSYVDATRPLATAKKDNAREWLGNGLFHLSEAQEAVGDIASAIRSLQEILDNPDVQSSDIGRQLGEIAAGKLKSIAG